MTAVVLALYWIGSGRAYGFDASVTVHRFVATRSLLDPFRRQAVYNNHPLFSFLDHLVYSLLHSSDERVLRIVPILASALSAGLVAAVLARRLGVTAALSAAAVLTWSPVLIGTGREVRGYSLLLFASIVSTVLLFEMRRSSRVGWQWSTAYVLALAGGIATHLYGLAMLPVHAAVVGRDRGELRRWLPRWLIGGVLGLAVYAPIAATMVHAHRGRQFRGDFPLKLAQALLGGTWLTALLMALPVAVGLGLAWRRGWARRAGTTGVAIVLVLWLLGPEDLYPRFFVLLLPAVAYLVALGVARLRVASLLVAALVVVEVVRLGPGLARSELPNRTASRLAEAAARAGRSACAFGPLSAAAMEAYDPGIRTVGLTARPPSCDLILVVYLPLKPASFTLPASWQTSFRFRKLLPAASPGLAFARQPLGR